MCNAVCAGSFCGVSYVGLLLMYEGRFGLARIAINRKGSFSQETLNYNQGQRL